MKICFCGPQSCGKTTVLDQIKSYYPQGTFVKEVVRGLDRKINLEATSETQLLIYLKHCQNLLINNNFIIYDRGLIDSIAYSRVSFQKGVLNKDILYIGETLLDDLKNQYDLYFYFPPNIPLIEDGVRSIDLDYRNLAHQAFLDIFREKNINYFSLEGNIFNRIEFINKKIKEFK